MTIFLSPEATNYSLGFYARQPMFDNSGHLQGYSIYFRDGQCASVPYEGQEAGATHNVLAALLGEGGGKRMSVKFAAQSLIYELPLMFPKEALTVEVREGLFGDAQAPDSLRKIKAKGYLVAVGHFTGRPDATILHAMADVLWVDALAAKDTDLARLAESCQLFSATAGLMRIEDRCVYERGKALGFQLFQGHYFQQPETVCTRKLSSSQFSRLKLLQAIEQKEPNLRNLAETIRTDVALSYKLFGLLNSTHFSLPNPIHSVQQALALIGWEPLRTWIRLVILTDLTPTGKTSELPRSATQRGRFLELMAQGRKHPGPEVLFLVGLFSLLPAMLDQTMEQILEYLHLPEEVSTALLGQESVCADWLALAIAFERAGWAAVQATLTRLGLAPLAVATAYSQAVEWTDALFRSVPT